MLSLNPTRGAKPRARPRCKPCLSALFGALLISIGASSARAEAPFRKGPYLMDLRPDAVAILFELEAAQGATLSLEGGRGSGGPRASETALFHEVLAEGLAPSTQYRYAIRLEDGTEARGRFRTAPEVGGGPITFAVYGDNRTDHLAHAAVVRSISSGAYDFVLNTGDMVAIGETRDDWQTFFEIAGPLLRDTPLFPVLGNHELAHWGRGYPNYQRYVRAAMDTRDRPYYRFDFGNARFLVLDSNDTWEPGSKQRRWLEGELEAARSAPGIEHLFAAAHHGPLSSGRHGENARMRDAGVTELLREGGVELIFSGHDHLYERGEWEGLKYVVTGGGGAPLYRANRRAPYQLAFEPVHHHCRLRIEGREVSLEALRADGSLIERCVYAPSEPWVCDDGRPEGPVRGDRSPWLDWLLLRWPRLLGLALLLLALGWVLRRRARARRGEDPPETSK